MRLVFFIKLNIPLSIDFCAAALSSHPQSKIVRSRGNNLGKWKENANVSSSIDAPKKELFLMNKKEP